MAFKMKSILIFVLCLSLATSMEVLEKQEKTSQKLRLKETWYPKFNKETPIEFMIGLSLGTLSFLKLFLPLECPKSSIEVAMESFDYYVFYN